jgi:hypothetical protein
MEKSVFFFVRKFNYAMNLQEEESQANSDVQYMNIFLNSIHHVQVQPEAFSLTISP